jgi:hypothetical protein
LDLRAWLLGVIFISGCHQVSPPDNNTTTTNAAVKGGSVSSSVIDQEARQAVSIAAAYLPKLSLAPDEYRVIFVDNVLSGENASPVRWRVGFKRRALFPPDASGLIGKGGEVFVDVDVATNTVLDSKGGE